MHGMSSCCSAKVLPYARAVRSCHPRPQQARSHRKPCSAPPAASASATTRASDRWPGAPGGSRKQSQVAMPYLHAGAPHQSLHLNDCYARTHMRSAISAPSSRGLCLRRPPAARNQGSLTPRRHVRLQSAAQVLRLPRADRPCCAHMQSTWPCWGARFDLAPLPRLLKPHERAAERRVEGIRAQARQLRLGHIVQVQEIHLCVTGQRRRCMPRGTPSQQAREPRRRTVASRSRRRLRSRLACRHAGAMQCGPSATSGGAAALPAAASSSAST